MKSARPVFCVCAAALTLFFSSAPAAERPAPPAAAPASEELPLPDAAGLQRLARRALLEVTGRRMLVGPVTLRAKLADGSWLVLLTLENGRQVRGRLYRHKRRYRIAVEVQDLYAAEQTVTIVR